MFKVDANWVKVTTPPFYLGSKNCLPEPTTPSMQFDSTPWKGTRVTVTGDNQYKGIHGIIKDVLCNQKTSSGLRFLVELQYVPIRVELFDYDHLLEASCVA